MKNMKQVNAQAMKGVEATTPKAKDLQEILLEVQMALSGSAASDKLSTARKLQVSIPYR